MRKFVIAATAAIALSVGLSACKADHPDTAKFKAALEKGYASSEVCLGAKITGFPVTVSRKLASDQVIDALATAGFMTRTQGGDGIELDLTDKAWEANVFNPETGRICYGKKQLVTIDQSDIVDVTKGRSIIVGHTWTVIDVPAWAKGLHLEGVDTPAKASTTLEVDGLGGWQVRPSINDWVRGR